MKIRTNVLIAECIERGVARGYARAHKHVENPTRESIISAIEEAVASEIYEYFSFDDEVLL